MRAARCRAALAALATLGALASPVLAAGPLGPDGTPIRTSNYSVDLAQTPVLAGTRVTGLAGAYVAIAEGTDGNIQTPVAPAVRTSYALDHFDYEFALGLTLPATLTSTDFFNTGRGRTVLSDANQKGFVFFTPAVNLVWGKIGLGATAEFQSYDLARQNDAPATATQDRITAQFVAVHIQMAQTFAKGQLVIGIGARGIQLDVTGADPIAGNRPLFSTGGWGGEAGLLIMPRRQRFRIGASFRSAVTTAPSANSTLSPTLDGDRVIGDPANAVDAFWLPDHASVPWDLNVGFAISFGARPFNVPFEDPKGLVDDTLREEIAHTNERATIRNAIPAKASPAARDAVDAELDSEAALSDLRVERIKRDSRRALLDRERARPRRYLLLTTSLVLTGTVPYAVGIESFLQRTVGRSGRRLTYSPRLGVETEVIPHWVKVRAGSYLEPSRFDTGSARVHGTFGFDTKLFPWEVFGLFDEGTEWRLSTAVDSAPRYFGWGVSVGVWH